ncbi:MAG: tRNA (adenosine(37)-N6)-dimethylallyltransferase MiaA [Deferribacteraceae bacterium]|jgi:tRNA dimethylallyltransferase|nr:tRNA (adenosine(37)-N6)-dimethylallyltransferase MiaA [Deferribacteraceae bacterium]
MANVIPIITGPTASGKSGLLYKLFDQGFDFEYISADAFQVYQGLDIGTAKPSIELRQHIPHHLIDIIPADSSYTAGDFVAHAEAAIEAILDADKHPVIAGGTGLYIQALRDGIFEVPSDATIRQELQLRLDTEGNHKLYHELQGIDPTYAAKIHENDSVRILRALEVYRITGLPISIAHKELRKPPRYSYNVMVIDKKREELYADINKRTENMIAEGWMEEVRSLLASGITPDMPSFRAIGYKELTMALSSEITLAEATSIIAQKTRNYAKRQLTLFRGMLDGAKFMSAEAIAKNLS